MEIFNIQNWQNIWGFIILVGLPLLFVIITIIYQKRKSLGEKVVAFNVARFLLTPSLIIYLSCNKILEISEELTSMKVLESMITMAFASILFSVINHLILSKNNPFTNKELMPKLG
ncbi:MAG: hypothetical protein AAF806_25375, partial [Bacteroidota bacterium]